MVAKPQTTEVPVGKERESSTLIWEVLGLVSLVVLVVVWMVQHNPVTKHEYKQPHEQKNKRTRVPKVVNVEE